MKGQFRLTKREKIREPSDFKRVMREGKRIDSKHFVLFCHETERGFHRLGVVVKKSIGPATYRNRLRRYMREFFRLHKAQKNGSFDVVVLAREANLLRHYREAEKELKWLFLRREKVSFLGC